MHKLLLSFLLFSCSGKAPEQNPELSANNASFETTDFSFNYPDNWREAGLMSGLKAHVEESYTPDEFRDGMLYMSTNFSVYKEVLTEKSLKKAGDKYEEKIRTSTYFTNGKIAARKNVEFAGIAALDIIGTAKLQKWDVQWKIIILNYKDHYFEISTMSEQQRFEDMKPVTEAIFNSFEFK